MVETRETVTHLEEELGEDVERTSLGVGRVGRTEWMETKALCILDDVAWQRATKTLKKDS